MKCWDALVCFCVVLIRIHQLYCRFMLFQNLAIETLPCNFVSDEVSLIIMSTAFSPQVKESIQTEQACTVRILNYRLILDYAFHYI